MELVEELLRRGLDPCMRLTVDLMAVDDVGEDGRTTGKPSVCQMLSLTLPQLYSLQVYRDWSQSQKGNTGDAAFGRRLVVLNIFVLLPILA